MKREIKHLNVASEPISLRSRAVTLQPSRAEDGRAGHAEAAPVIGPRPAPADSAAEYVQLHARAEKMGFDEGYQRGLEKARGELDLQLKHLAQLCTQIQKAQEALQQKAHEDAAEFAFTVACRVLGRTALDPLSIRATVAAVLREAQGLAPQTLRVHPKDLPLVREMLSASDSSAVQVMADASVTLGGCLVDTSEHGTLDGRLESQLAELKAALVASRAGGI